MEPYLSVVVTTRNDDHGGDPLKRLQAFIKSFDAQCRCTGLRAEVIVVEWNPPSDRPRLQGLVEWPEPLVCAYRFVRVPPELHGTLEYSDVLPLFQMIAKNVGIRRARGRFVLATNIDIIFSNELIRYIASGQLEPGCMYRVDRHDIQAAFPVDAPLDVQMAYCAAHQLRVHARWGSYAVDGSGRALPMAEDIVDGRAVQLGSGWHVREESDTGGFYRWATDRAQVRIDPTADPSISGATGLEIEFEPNPHDPTSSVKIDIVDDTGRTRSRLRITRRCVFRLTLDSDPGLERCTLELRVVAPSTDRQRQLAVFERRGSMHYLVRSIRLTSLDQARACDAFVYPPDGWRVVQDAALESHSDHERLSVVTSPRKWSYCLEFGPLRAPETATYRFTISYTIIEGDVSLGIQGFDRASLAASVDDIMTPDGHIRTLSAQLQSGQEFWLMLSNDRADGYGISRVVIKELTGSAEFTTLAITDAGLGIPRGTTNQRTAHAIRVMPGSFRVGRRGHRLDEPSEVERAYLRSDVQADQAVAIPERRQFALTRADPRRRDEPNTTTARALTVIRGVLRPVIGSGRLISVRVNARARRARLALAAWIERRRSLERARAQEALQFPPSGWRAASLSPVLHVERVGDGVSVVTDRRKWSYCLEQGPARAPATGAYQFELGYQLLDGGVQLGILSEDRQSWLPSASNEAIAPDGSTLTLSANLRSGQVYWLVLSNNHPDGDGVSRFIVRELTASVNVRHLLPKAQATIAHLSPRVIDRGRLAFSRSRPVVTDARDATEYPLQDWRAADPRTCRVEYSEAGISVATGERKWSYSLELGPMRAVVTGTYRFELTYELISGAVTLGVLDRGKKKWLRSSSTAAITPDGHTLAVSVDLRAGRVFWLIVSNNHPDGDGISRFNVHALTSSVDLIDWRLACVRAIGRWWTASVNRATTFVRRVFQAIVTGASPVRASGPVSKVRVSLGRLRDRVRSRIVHNAPEYAAAQAAYRALEEEHRTTIAQLRQLSPLGELAHIYKLLQERRPDDLHLNGCGDFQLMAREHWFDLRGYPEFQTFSMNIDGLFANIAHEAGIRERPLESPYHVYHLEHEVGSGWTPEGEALLRRRIAERGVTWLDSRDVYLWSAYMHWLRRPMIFNTSEWGFGACRFDESVIESRPKNLT